jgi:hypothetical protein
MRAAKTASRAAAGRIDMISIPASQSDCASTAINATRPAPQVVLASAQAIDGSVRADDDNGGRESGRSLRSADSTNGVSTGCTWSGQ